MDLNRIEYVIKYNITIFIKNKSYWLGGVRKDELDSGPARWNVQAERRSECLWLNGLCAASIELNYLIKYTASISWLRVIVW
jgi:hypothetical protein